MDEETTVHEEVRTRYAAVNRALYNAAEQSGRDPHDIALIAVAKRQNAPRVHAMLDCGHRVYGENYVQEAQDRWQALRAARPELRLHLVGGLQSNKAEDAVALFDVIHTLDRPKLAQALAKAMSKRGKSVDLLVQVNTGEEAQKSGIVPDALDDFLARCREEWALPIKGLMCIPPADEEPALHFALLRQLAARHDLPWLSMGMSDDFPTAIAFGATHIRVGTALFGARETA